MIFECKEVWAFLRKNNTLILLVADDEAVIMCKMTCDKQTVKTIFFKYWDHACVWHLVLLPVRFNRFLWAHTHFINIDIFLDGWGPTLPFHDLLVSAFCLLLIRQENDISRPTTHIGAIKFGVFTCSWKWVIKSNVRRKKKCSKRLVEIKHSQPLQ